jgi:hypothetical protein
MEYKCKYCNKQCKNKNSWVNHERCCPKNDNRNYKNGMCGKIPWNKGLTKTEASNLSGGKSGAFRGRKHTEETKKKISEKLSINNKGGRCKWFSVSGQNVQGTWEKNIAEKLNSMFIKWEKLKVHKHSLKYEIDGISKTYTPDFYLKDYNIYLEIKGYWWGNDERKMDIIIKKYPEKKIIIVKKEQYEKILDGELVW